MAINLSENTILVTGGGGFIGSYLTERLVESGADVRVADNFIRGDRSRLDGVADDIDVLPVDLTTYKGCSKATAGVDHVFHLAASVGGIHYIQGENVGGLTPSVLMNQKMLEAASQNDVKRFLFASSACVYRQQHDDLNQFTEEQAIPANPHSTYGWAKILGEIACNAYYQDTLLRTSCARIFNCYGPRENLDPDRSHVIPSLCRKVVEEPDGGSIELFGDGTQERGFIYVTDLVDGLIEVMRSYSSGEPINLGNASEVVSINELAERIIALSDKDLSIEHDLSKPTGTDKYACDTSKMEAELDWKPSVSLDEGLSQTYRWVAEQLGADEQQIAADGGADK